MTKLILTHDLADFDAAASGLAAFLLFPGAVPLLPKRIHNNLLRFLEANPGRFPFESQENYRKKPAAEAVLVDVQLPCFGAPVNAATRFTVIDHHPQRENVLTIDSEQVEAVGACTTLMTERLWDAGIIPDPDQATLMLLGIYEDTGFLSYGSTTSRDIAAAARLCEAGADPDVLRLWLHSPLTDTQRQVMDRLLEDCSSEEISGKQIVFARADVRGLSDEFVPVAHALRDMLNPDALLLILGQKTAVRVICRSTTDAVDVGRLMKNFNGGGHSRAASGVVNCDGEDGIPLLMDRVLAELRALLPTYITSSELYSPLSLRETLERSLPEASLSLIRFVSETAEALGYPIYIVGGVVRDLLLGKPIFDFDIVVEGDAIRLGKQLCSEKGKLLKHPQFGTAKWFPGDSEIESLDLVTSRFETYAHPAALPDVTAGSIREDLLRRDFTLNTLALRLDGEHFGELLDLCGGLADLKDGLIRTLHPLSFTDDPTRIFRAVRFADRFGFTIEPETLRQLRYASSLIALLSGARISHELQLIFREDQALRMMADLDDMGVFRVIHEKLRWTGNDADRWTETLRSAADAPWLYEDGPAAVWLCRYGEAQIRRIAERLHFSGQTEKTVLGVMNLRASFPDLMTQTPGEITPVLDRLPMASIEIYEAMCGDEAQRAVLGKYILEWQFIRPYTDGRDLQAMGVRPGPLMGKLLKDLRTAKLNGEVRTEDDETQWLLEKLDGLSDE